MRYLTLPELLELHRRLVEQTGGAAGLRDLGRLEAALAQPRMAFDGADLYPSLIEKAVALGFTLIMIIRLWMGTNASATRRST